VDAGDVSADTRVPLPLVQQLFKLAYNDPALKVRALCASASRRAARARHAPLRGATHVRPCAHPHEELAA
jgi:hypothetical protein